MNCHPFRAAILLLCAARFAAADVVTLKDGRVLEGKVLEDDGKVLKIKLKKGVMSLNRADVESVVQKPTPEEEYKERLAKMDLKNAAANLEIGRWAAGRGLEDEAIQHLFAAFSLEPGLDGLAAEFSRHDYHFEGGCWLNPDTYYPRIGYTKLDGHWCSPAELAFRLALKEVATAGSARDAAKAALLTSTTKLKKIEARLVAERATIDRLAKLVAKAEADQAAAEARFTAAGTKVQAASEKLTAVQQKEKVKEGEPLKDPSPALKDATNKLVAARAAAEKEGKAVSAAQAIVNTQTTEKTAAERRLLAIEDESKAAGKEIAALESDAEQAQNVVEAGSARAEELKAAWEKSK